MRSSAGAGKDSVGCGAGNLGRWADLESPKTCAGSSERAAENPTWGEERIAHEWKRKLSVPVSPRTVGKLPPQRRTGTHARPETALTSVRNHSKVKVILANGNGRTYPPYVKRVALAVAS